MMQILGIIPARYASTRFPGKPLISIGNKSMIRRVYEQASKATTLSKVIVATDHPLIFNHVRGFGGEVVMTSEAHPSGTDRCFEALQQSAFQADYVVNIQGDEPFIQPQQIELLTNLLNGKVEIATLVKKIDSQVILFDQNVPKVVFNQRQEAMYFSRETIPYLRGVALEQWLDFHVFYKHIGIYAYRSDILEKLTRLPPSSLEKVEALEQLRWLEHGYRIKVAITPFDSQGIDVPSDLERIKKFL